MLTTLRILEQKGHVTHEEVGRAYLYRPLIARDTAAGSAVKNVVEKFFGNSTGALALRSSNKNVPRTKSSRGCAR